MQIVFPKPRTHPPSDELEMIISKLVSAASDLVMCHFPDAGPQFLMYALPRVVNAARDAMEKLIDAAELEGAIGK